MVEAELFWSQVVFVNFYTRFMNCWRETVTELFWKLNTFIKLHINQELSRVLIESAHYITLSSTKHEATVKKKSNIKSKIFTEEIKLTWWLTKKFKMYYLFLIYLFYICTPNNYLSIKIVKWGRGIHFYQTTFPIIPVWAPSLCSWVYICAKNVLKKKREEILQFQSKITLWRGAHTFLSIDFHPYDDSYDFRSRDLSSVIYSKHTQIRPEIT